MRRNALALSLALVLMLVLSGCRLFRKDPGPESAYYPGPDTYNTTQQDTAYQPDPYPAYGTPVQTATAQEPVTTTPTFATTPTTTRTPTLTATPSSTRYHMVVKKDTLYSLARKYYGDHRRWKDIFEANRNVISDPNKIHIGDRLVIP